MLVYEVNLEVDNEIIEEFKNWLPNHVAEILKFKGFKSGHIFTEISENIPDKVELMGTSSLVVHYFVDSAEALNEYFLHHASQMRAQAARQFGARFRAKRRVLKNDSSLKS